MTNHHASNQQPTPGLLLPGLDGANPLAFLAAMGLFRILTGETDLALLHMRWTASGGSYVPVLIAPDPSTLDQQTALDKLDSLLVSDISQHPIAILRALADTKDDPDERRNIFVERMQDAHANNRTHADWLAALASDFASSEAINQLQTTRRDYFYGNLTSIISNTKVDHLRRAIFHPWDYADPLDRQSLHLDPSEDRRHAHQWNTPAGDPDRKRSGGMLGANRLAIEAIPLFTSVPHADTLRTIGFTGVHSDDTRWTWPLWRHAIGLSVAHALLCMPELQQEQPSPESAARLHARGVLAAYRTCRILVGKTPNFTPSRAV